MKSCAGSLGYKERGGSVMRLFIAVLLTDPMTRTLVGAMHDLKKAGLTGNYVPAKNMHMTLAFIGETDNVEGAKRAMDSLPLEKFRISLTDGGFFGDLLYAGVKGNQKIKKYVSDLKKALRENGVPCDTDKFNPHITLIRQVKGRRPASVVIPSADMTVEGISLMRSDMKDGKRVYKEIYRVS